MSQLLRNRLDVAESISRVVKQARRRRSLTITDVARYLGISESLYLRIEMAKELPDAVLLANMVHVLGVDANEALGVAAVASGKETGK